MSEIERGKILPILKLFLLFLAFVLITSILSITVIWNQNEKKNNLDVFEDVESITICDDKNHVTSNFGSDEYYCYGSCSCFDDEEDLLRRVMGRSSSFISKGATMFVTALSGIIAIRLAKPKLRDYCHKQLYEICDPSSIISEVDSCMYNSLTENDVLEDQKSELDIEEDRSFLKHFPESLVFYKVSKINAEIGYLMVARFSSKKQICFLGLTDDLKDLRKSFSSKFYNLQFEETDSDPYLTEISDSIIDFWSSPRDELDEYLNQIDVDFSTTTSFQKLVLERLRQIPPGKTMSYSELANEVDVPCGARAVANVMSSNKVALICPCHRVIRKNGDIGEFGYGVDKKEYLLKREGCKKFNDELFDNDD